jgi:hypothetical protein
MNTRRFRLPDIVITMRTTFPYSDITVLLPLKRLNWYEDSDGMKSAQMVVTLARPGHEPADYYVETTWLGREEERLLRDTGLRPSAALGTQDRIAEIIKRPNGLWDYYTIPRFSKA